MAERTCSIDGCARLVHARGWCKRHYQIWCRHGDPEWRHPVRGAGGLQRFERRVTKGSDPDGCWLWTGGEAARYGLFSTGSKAAGTYRQTGAHVFALEHALGRQLLPGMCACHTCDNPRCVRNDTPGFYELNGVLHPSYGHLWEGTTQDNTADKVAKGRGPFGTRNGVYRHPERVVRGEVQWLAKLTEDKVRIIRQRAAAGDLLHDLAIEFGVGDTTVRHVVRRETWKHVD